MHGPRWSAWSANAVGCPGSPHSDSVFRSNTSTDQTNRDQNRFRWSRGVVHLLSPLPARSRRQVPPLGVGDPFPQVSRDTCSGTASIWPLRGYTLGRQARRRCSIPQRYFSMAVHNRLANLLGCLLYVVQVAASIGIRAPFELGRRLRQSPT